MIAPMLEKTRWNHEPILVTNGTLSRLLMDPLRVMKLMRRSNRLSDSIRNGLLVVSGLRSTENLSKFSLSLLLKAPRSTLFERAAAGSRVSIYIVSVIIDANHGTM